MSTQYRHTVQIHNLRAPREVAPLIMDMVKPRSILDVGCGIGTWLKAFEELGITDYVGVDGDFVDRTLLEIEKSKFVVQDLRNPMWLERKFDLVVSLEVAEHLPEESADLFIQTLIGHGDTILFSAAIPHQGGQDHLNEQWPDYWQKKFEHHGFYCHDVIRPVIWDNDKIDWWYRQNIMLVSRVYSGEKIRSLVHPECLLHNKGLDAARIEYVQSGGLGVVKSFKIFIREVYQKIFQ